MSDGAHLLIPFASSTDPALLQAVRGLALPHLDALLTRLAPQPPDAGDARSLSMPHERALARALGLPGSDGLIALAAHESALGNPASAGLAAAWITPCHWRVGRDHIDMDDPAALQLSEGESHAFFDAMQPYFSEDGIALAFASPARWIAHGEIFHELPSASLDRVSGRMIDPWMPRSPQAATLRRLQQEMQMLLYTHPLNDERVAHGLLPVNSFWVSGTGALPAAFQPAWPQDLRVAGDLRAPALRGDAAAWLEAWRTIDSREGARLAAALQQAGGPVTLTLCGERRAQAFTRPTGGWWASLHRAFARPRVATRLETL